MKYKFLRKPVVDRNGVELIDEATGEVEWYVPSTTELDKAEYAVFLDQIHLWANEFANVDLPLPDKNYKLNFQDTYKQKLQDGNQNP